MLYASNKEHASATPKQNAAPATDQPAYDPCKFVGRGFGNSGDLIDFNKLAEEEKKLPTRVFFPIDTQSLADGFLALESFAETGISQDASPINLLGLQLNAECRARISDESTIIALQNQLKELQRQVSLLQKELRSKPAPKGDRP